MKKPKKEIYNIKKHSIKKYWMIISIKSHLALKKRKDFNIPK